VKHDNFSLWFAVRILGQHLVEIIRFLILVAPDFLVTSGPVSFYRLLVETIMGDIRCYHEDIFKLHFRGTLKTCAIENNMVPHAVHHERLSWESFVGDLIHKIKESFSRILGMNIRILIIACDSTFTPVEKSGAGPNDEYRKILAALEVFASSQDTVDDATGFIRKSMDAKKGGSS